ncbi:MAG: hypothetical protein KatS3mg105_1937 [Gemmatales bacterium]|nr:MAG: hypothetical protein KatS3mg105_1937 [Gemmatales bacterium]
MRTPICCATCLVLTVLAAPLDAQTVKIPVILDTDIGTDVDDAFALALAVASPELDLVAVTTCADQGEDRAYLACRFLTQVGVKSIPVAVGQPPQPKYGLDWQIQYRRHPAAIFNRTLKPVKMSAVDLLRQKLNERPGTITLVCLGPLTNVARLLQKDPDVKKQIKRIVLMGGSLAVGYGGKKRPEPEWNIKSDIASAQVVFAAGVPLTVIPLDATVSVQLAKAQRKRLFDAHNALTFQVQNLYELWDKETPTLFDPVAVAATFSEKYLSMKNLRLEVTDQGMTQRIDGKPNARVALSIDADAFITWYVDRLRAAGEPVLPQPPKNRTQLVDDGGFPTRVHAWEDYETDIEKRWWMCGKLETKDVPPGGRRCCRAVLTQDFDARMGDTKAMYRAVIFNPVPGPPMGGNTRLRFRYKLVGTDTLRVQLYSLTNGYHRYLSVSGLPTKRWQTATVDMTAMRRPDGSGGPLSANERIDDIQFYIDPRAELLIDDIVLYEAAGPNEKRAFPQRILYSAGFDTGKKGVHWLGDFDIIKHAKPRTWRTARSVIRQSDGMPWLRFDLKGSRLLHPKTELFFRYRLSKGEQVSVELRGGKGEVLRARVGVALKTDAWEESTIRFTELADKVENQPVFVDEIRFLLPRGAEMQLDDILLYVPGE